MQAPQWCDQNDFNGCPIIIQSSYASNSGCHDSGSTNSPGVLTTYQQIYNASSSSRAVAVNGTMPQNSISQVSQKSAIIWWIDNGGINNQIILQIIIHQDAGQEVLIENYLPVHSACMPVHYKSCSRCCVNSK